MKWACLFGGHADPLGSVFMLDQCRWLLMENTTLTIQQGLLFASVMVLSGSVFTMWKPKNGHQSV